MRLRSKSDPIQNDSEYENTVVGNKVAVNQKKMNGNRRMEKGWLLNSAKLLYFLLMKMLILRKKFLLSKYYRLVFWKKVFLLIQIW